MKAFMTVLLEMEIALRPTLFQYLTAGRKESSLYRPHDFQKYSSADSYYFSQGGNKYFACGRLPLRRRCHMVGPKFNNHLKKTLS
jgi:hypothetical protein